MQYKIKALKTVENVNAGWMTDRRTEITMTIPHRMTLVAEGVKSQFENLEII